MSTRTGLGCCRNAFGSSQEPIGKLSAGALALRAFLSPKHGFSPGAMGAQDGLENPAVVGTGRAGLHAVRKKRQKTGGLLPASFFVYLPIPIGEKIRYITTTTAEPAMAQSLPVFHGVISIIFASGISQS